jgi:hypothetical protein
MTRPGGSWLVAVLVALSAGASTSIANGQTLEPPPGYSGSPPPAAYGSGATSPTDGTPTGNPAISTAEESKDSGLGLEWVYLNADLGGGFASMNSFSEQTLGLKQTSSGGPAFGVAAGVRLFFFSVGVRVRDLQLSGIGDLWELNGEAAFHTRIGRVDPYFGVRGGYNFVGSLSSSTVSVATGDSSSVSVHGFNVGPVVGIDYYLAKYVSLGIDLDAQFLFLQRPQLAIPGASGGELTAQCQQDPQCAQLYQQSGNSVGFAFVPTAHLGIHF